MSHVIAYRAVLASDADLACAFSLKNGSVRLEDTHRLNRAHHLGCREMSKEMWLIKGPIPAVGIRGNNHQHLYSCDQSFSRSAHPGLELTAIKSTVSTIAKASYNAYQLVLYVCQTRLLPQHFKVYCALWLAPRDMPMLWTLSAREYLCGVAIAADESA